MRVFVTGASGHIGSAVVPELIQAGHEVVGLARSDASSAAVKAMGAEVRRGDIADLDGLREAAADADAVIHLAFNHGAISPRDFADAATADLAVGAGTRRRAGRPERQAQVREVLEQAGVAETATIFVGHLGDTMEARRVADRAWALVEVEHAYENFLAEVRTLRPAGAPETLAAQIRLVQEWRRFPFLDPGLPPELLPPGWSGTRAAALFRDRHTTWKPVADAWWQEMAGNV
jgi:hypothetical protein